MTSPKRSRSQFVWHRILDDNACLPSISVKEYPNETVLRMMLDMNRDDETVRGCLEKLEAYDRVRGQRVAVYEQKTLEAGGSYDGCLKLGRAYSNSYLNWFSRKIVNTMYKNTHAEIDMCNAMPTMLCRAFDHLNLGALQAYVDDPETVFAGFHRDLGVDKTAVKKMVISVICSHPATSWDMGQGFNMDLVRGFSGHPFVMGVKEDLDRMARALREQYPEYYEVMRMRADKEGKADRVDGIALFYLATDMEHSVMRCVIEKLGLKDDFIWYFDSVVVPLAVLGESSIEEVCADLQQHVHRQLGIRVRFRQKDMMAKSLAWSLSDLERGESGRYQAWKRDFEKVYCVFKHPAKFGRIHGGGYHFLDRQGFNHCTMSDPADMVKKWLNDPRKRFYESIEFAPPPFRVAVGNYNSWRGFAAEALDEIVNPEEVKRRVQPYHDHVHILMGSRTEYTEYFHKLMAYKIQNPGYTWGVMPFIRSTQGVGKDQWFKFVGNMVGPDYCLSVTNISDVMGKSTGLMENKLFVSFSEVCYEDSKRHEEDLKKLITDHRMVVERKYVPSYENRMTACLVAFSNNYGALRINMDDRRYFPVTASGFFANDPAYHGPFNDYIRDPLNQRAVFQWLRDMELGEFLPMANRPMTETQVEMADSARPVFDVFMEKRFEDLVSNATTCPSRDLTLIGAAMLQISAKHLWDEFGIMLEELKWNNMDTRGKVEKYGTRQLSEFKSRIERYKTLAGEVICKRRRSYGIIYYVDIMAVRQYLQAHAEEEEVDDDETISF